jgi:hypothetical protein
MPPCAASSVGQPSRPGTSSTNLLIEAKCVIKETASRPRLLPTAWRQSPLCQTPVRHEAEVNLCSEQGETGST